MVIAFVIFSLYWIMLTSGQNSVDVGPFDFGLDHVTDPIRDAIRAITLQITDTLFVWTEGAVSSAFDQGFAALDSGASVWDATVQCVVAVFNMTEDITKKGIRDLITWAYGRDINDVEAGMQTSLETLLGSAHNVSATLDIFTYFFGTVDQQITAIYSALSEIGQVSLPMIYTLLGALAHEIEDAIGGLLGLEGVIVPGIHAEFLRLNDAVSFLEALLTMDQPLIGAWVTDIPDIKGRVKALEDILAGLAGAIPLTPEMVAELAALAGIAGLSAIAIENIITLGENPCAVVEMCSLATGGDSLVEAAAIASMMGFN